jgi:hypothetical protein
MIARLLNAPLNNPALGASTIGLCAFIGNYTLWDFTKTHAKLMAITHESNFLSTAGLCLHYSIGDVVVTFRKSDKAWLSIWSSAMEQQAHPPAHSSCPS